MSSLFRAPTRPRVPQVRLLAADSELGAELEPDAEARARELLRAPVARIGAGRWEPRTSGAARGVLGLLVLDGVLVRRSTLAGITSSELLGAGDLLRPWQEDDAAVACSSEWRVLAPVQLAVLDTGFTAQAAVYPEVIAALFERAFRRSRRRGLATSIARMNRVDDRLVLLMSHLAERWGRVTPEGIVVPIPLTHQTLAELVGAQRPTVSSALGRLARQGALSRRSDRCWVISAQDAGEGARLAA